MWEKALLQCANKADAGGTSLLGKNHLVARTIWLRRGGVSKSDRAKQ